MASANGYDVSNLKWVGNETYAEVLFEFLAKSPTFLAATGLRLRRGHLCVSTFKHSTAGGATRWAFAIPTFIRWPPTLRGSGISSRLIWRRGSPRRLAFQAPRIKQLTIVKISFVWAVVKTSDVVVYGWKTFSSYRGEPLTMQRLPSPASHEPRLLARREWVFNISFIYGFILCIDVLYASPLLHRVRQLIYSRRPPQQVQSARYQYNSLRAFLSPSDWSDFLELFPEFAPCFAMYERFVNNVVDFIIDPAEIKMVGRG